MCELDYKATSDTDNNPEKHEPINIIKTSVVIVFLCILLDSSCAELISWKDSFLK